MVHQYTNKVFYNTPVLTVANLPISAQTGEIRLVIAEDSIYQYTGSTWVNTGVRGTGGFQADGSVPATNTWNLSGFGLLNLGETTSPSNQGFSFLSRVADGASSVVFEIDTVNNILNASARLLSIKVQGVEKFSIDKNGDIIVGGGLVSSGNVDIFLDTIGSDTIESFTVWHNTTMASGGLELFQVRANEPGVGEAEVFGNLIVNNNLKTRGFQLDRTAATEDILSSGQSLIGVTDTTYPVVVTLSDDDLVEGRIIIVKDESGGASGNNITVAPESPYVTIDGNADEIISINYDYRTFYSDGANWFTI